MTELSPTARSSSGMAGGGGGEAWAAAGRAERWGALAHRRSPVRHSALVKV